jgi:hypothetical protein
MGNLLGLWAIVVFCCAVVWMINVAWTIKDNENNAISNIKAKYSIRDTTKWCFFIAIFPISIPGGLVYGIYRTFRWYHDHIKALKTAPWVED